MGELGIRAARIRVFQKTTYTHVQITTIIITGVYAWGAAEESPWDSSTHKGGDTQSPPFPHCNALHCTRIYTPLLLLLNALQWTFPSKKVLFRSLPEVLGDQIVDFSGHSEQEYLLILAEKSDTFKPTPTPFDHSNGH